MPDVTVYFATNRMPATDATGTDIVNFGSELGPIDGTAVRFGSAGVAVSGLSGSLIPGSLVVAPETLIGPNQRRGSRDIFDQLRQDMKDGGRPTLVTVHGFSNSFTDAIERAAVIQNFYGLDANVFAFTWPSRGSALPGDIPLPYADYIHDRETARASGVAMARTLRILYDFIDALPMREVCRQPLHLICHSMGNYAFRHALQALMQMSVGAPREVAPPVEGDAGRSTLPVLIGVPTDGSDPNRLRRTFDQIILAAADEDDDAFDDPRELKYLPRLGAGVTIYHTERDWILSTLSRFTKFNGPRLGTDGPENMGSISDKVTAVDVSDVIDPREDIQSHQYYRIFPAVRDDIVAVLSGLPPSHVPNREALSSQRYRIVPTARRRRRGSSG